jgi:hypothetical protein
VGVMGATTTSAIVFDLLQQRPGLTRAALAEQLNITVPLVQGAVRYLMDHGKIVQTKRDFKTLGRFWIAGQVPSDVESLPPTPEWPPLEMPLPRVRSVFDLAEALGCMPEGAKE